jgi:hypothetical protein
MYRRCGTFSYPTIAVFLGLVACGSPSPGFRAAPEAVRDCSSGSQGSAMRASLWVLVVPTEGKSGVGTGRLRLYAATDSLGAPAAERLWSDPGDTLKFTNLDPGRYRAKAIALGWERTEGDLVLEPGRCVFLIARMKMSKLRLQEVLWGQHAAGTTAPPNTAMELVGRGGSRSMFLAGLRLPPHPHSSLPGR